MKTFVFLLLLLIAFAKASTYPRKNLAGPPSEFVLHNIPSVLGGAQDERSAMFYLNFDENDSGHLVSKINLDVDSADVFAFSFYSALADQFDLTLTNPAGQNVDLTSTKYSSDFPVSDDGSHTLPTHTYLLTNQGTGVFELTIQSKDNFAWMGATLPKSTVLLFNESPVRVHTHINTYSLETGSEIGLSARLTTDTEYVRGETLPAVLSGTKVSKAVMEVFLPSGEEVDVQMHDDGLGMDELANDGVWSAEIPASTPGDYLLTGLLEGTLENGTPFVRSTEHLVKVIDDHNQLTGKAVAAPGKNTNRLDLLVEVTQNTHTTYATYAEVWGVDDKGEAQPAAWIGGLANTETVGTANAVRMEFDLNWASMAGVKAPFTLRNAYLRCADSEVVVSRIAMITVDTSKVDPFLGGHLARLAAAPQLREPTEEMLMGVRPAHLAVNATAGDAALLLVHGYCAGSNPWSKHASTFNTPYFFENPNANLANDAFAQKVLAYCDSMGLKGFSGIGHSQGGIVLTHILNYYWSGMDTVSSANAGRMVQSVGTPYQGSSGAGTAANLAKIFGVACGSNFDLTTDGASLWLSGISSNTRSKITYYTTTYKLGKLLGDWCNLAVNLVLQWPNDGTSELDYAQLKGGVNAGNKEKWCHTTGMGYSAQYDDPSRNAEMNKMAAR